MGHVTVSRRETVTLTKSDEDFVSNEKSDQDLRTDITFTPVSTGNPHAVVFVEDMEKTPVDIWGPLMEHNERFPGGVNTEFIQVIDDHTLRMRVWERGSGITMACGTGSCASVAAAVQKGYCRVGEPVSVDLDGGTLEIRVDAAGEVQMTGPAETVYEGETV
jgi:diaminopimelate epimerase